MGKRPRWSQKGSGRQLLAATRATGGDDLAATDRGHAGAEAVTALADELGGLVGALHVLNSVLGQSRPMISIT